MAESGYNVSTQRLTSRWLLEDIPGLTLQDQSCWKVKCLAYVDSQGVKKSPVLDVLEEWRTTKPTEYEKLFRSITYVGGNNPHRNFKLIEHDDKKRNVFELRNNRCKCRLFAFYHPGGSRVIVCAETYWKGKGHHRKDQDRAFARCAKMRTYFEQSL